MTLAKDEHLLLLSPSQAELAAKHANEEEAEAGRASTTGTGAADHQEGCRSRASGIGAPSDTQSRGLCLMVWRTEKASNHFKVFLI